MLKVTRLQQPCCYGFTADKQNIPRGSVKTDKSPMPVFPENGRISGVFMVYLESKPQVYSFNASVAREACQSLNVNIATKGQVETAQKNGLQTCRYGWVAENFAVVPRTVRSERCGQNKLGVITWQAEPSKAFEVFCFNATAVLTALIISASVVLLLAAGAAGAIWYYKIRGRSFPLWTRIRNKEIIETEMWRHFSKRHQNSQQRSREDDTKSYDDITVQMDLDTD
ncbi:lymphatic vessel endothelial hyaluronic receptor 1b [Chanos chanos]|uniref:Lymphatic vessel endothelial hyaluronic receptor 1b n=1 Tax=Chanos chanos TaxID=29144 RepID=A0A6J2WRI7_CHACN|nr:lymphatic vessel endothelial hyaluronic acid receptor 1-like [Chanos chanos]